MAGKTFGETDDIYVPGPGPLGLQDGQGDEVHVQHPPLQLHHPRGNCAGGNWQQMKRTINLIDKSLFIVQRSE